MKHRYVAKNYLNKKTDCFSISKIKTEVYEDPDRISGIEMRLFKFYLGDSKTPSLIASQLDGKEEPISIYIYKPNYLVSVVDWRPTSRRPTAASSSAKSTSTSPASSTESATTASPPPSCIRCPNTPSSKKGSW